MIPWCLQYLQAFAVMAIPAVGALLAWQQVQIARVKLQHDLFDRRYRVFDATQRLLNSCAAGSASEEDMRAFLLDTGARAFLFNDDKLIGYLNDIQVRARDLQALRSEMSRPGKILHPRFNFNLEEDKTKAMDALSKHQTWFPEQLGMLVSKFEPSLKLDKSRWRHFFQN